MLFEHLFFDLILYTFVCVLTSTKSHRAAIIGTSNVKNSFGESIIFLWEMDFGKKTCSCFLLKKGSI